MRNFQDVLQAHSEIKRDLASFGLLHKTMTMQNQLIANDSDFFTKELVNYSYTIQDCKIEDIVKLDGFPLEYAHQEWLDRTYGINGQPTNPGDSWLKRAVLWSKFLVNGKFDYTYSERLVPFHNIIKTLQNDPGSRRAWFPIFWLKDLPAAHQKVRVPCSLGYNFQVRDGKLHVTYIMRSCDFITHWAVDVYMAVQLQHLLNRYLGHEIGSFTHFIASLHVYFKDVKEVF